MTYRYKIWFPMAQKFTILTEKEYNKALDALRASKGCFSIKTWAATDKQIIKMAAVAAQELQRKLWLKDEVSSMNIVKEAGCKVSTPEKGPFIEAVKPVYEKYASKYLNLIEQIQKLAK